MTLDHLTLESSAPDGLWGQTWRFMLLSDKLVLDDYSTWTRASKRHKAVTKERWSRLKSREATIKQADVPFTPAIAAWVKREWIKQAELILTIGFQA